ncbi:hypothetical protein MSG28_013213 [Choristoneura fumiferana]|uniref:Uncharacterized protein n=1 Tax=Choristoneura fumiferana TaxID=7141 RepID=A0ACC0KT07_CHOFU|nr:hypothetical protein MSG28_013213 [Choristoneura fumiferana]
MFESDDFDQVLSQFDFPDVSTKAVENLKDRNIEIKTDLHKPHSPENFVFNNISMPTQQNVLEKHVGKVKHTIADIHKSPSPLKFVNNNKTLLPPTPKTIGDKVEKLQTCAVTNNHSSTSINSENTSPKHTKRKIINSFFNQNAKRKFPGPAGLLSGNFEETKDETICHMELFSQDIDMSHFRGDKFESKIWRTLLDDVKSWNSGALDSINAVKQQAVGGNLRRMKAQAVAAFVETVDRSATDPLITLRDTTGYIKCTLHRDAWSTFSPYIVSEFCALVLRKPTVLTTGSAFKKHYLNITLSNIYAIYSSAVLSEDTESKPLPENYQINCDNNITIIKFISSLQNLDKDPFCNETANDTSDLLDDLDNIFNDDLF